MWYLMVMPALTYCIDLRDPADPGVSEMGAGIETPCDAAGADQLVRFSFRDLSACALLPASTDAVSLAARAAAAERDADVHRRALDALAERIFVRKKKVACPAPDVVATPIADDLVREKARRALRRAGLGGGRGGA
jgi:hypothetical protein